jgi:hypothetical protein
VYPYVGLRLTPVNVVMLQHTVLYTFSDSLRFFWVVPWYRKVLEVVFFFVFGLVICSGWFFGFILIWDLCMSTLFPVLDIGLLPDVVTNSVVSETAREVVAPQSHEMKHTLLFVALATVLLVGVGVYLVVDARNALDTAFAWDITRIVNWKPFPDIIVDIDKVGFYTGVYPEGFNALLATASEIVEDPVVQGAVQLAIGQPVAPVAPLVGAVVAGVAVGAVLEGVGAVEQLVVPGNDIATMLAMLHEVTANLEQLYAGAEPEAIAGFESILAFRELILEHGNTPQEFLPGEVLSRLRVDELVLVLSLVENVLGELTPLARWVASFIH